MNKIHEVQTTTVVVVRKGNNTNELWYIYHTSSLAIKKYQKHAHGIQLNRTGSRNRKAEQDFPSSYRKPRVVPSVDVIMSHFRSLPKHKTCAFNTRKLTPLIPRLTGLEETSNLRGCMPHRSESARYQV